MRHRLTLQERIRGIERALKSRRTPSHLKPGLEVHLRELKEQLREKSSKRASSSPGRAARVKRSSGFAIRL
jgi:hypothetical protein